MTSHVIQVVQHLRPGGIECMVLDLAARNAERTTIVALEGTREQTLAAWPRLRPMADRMLFLEKQPGISIAAIQDLASAFRHLKATAVHTHHIGPLLYGGLAARLAGIRRVVHTEHDAWHLDSPKRRQLERFLLATVRPVLVADSAMVARKLHGHLGPRSLQVIDNGIDIDRFRPNPKAQARRSLGLPTDRLIVGAAARLEHVKGIDMLIDAFHIVPDAHLAIAGDGTQRDALVRRVQKLGLSERVSFLGRIDAMDSFYPALDRFCLPSRHEGLPLSLLEAQACDVPAIVTPVGAMPDAIAPGSGSIACEVSVQGIAQAILRSIHLTPQSSPRDHVVRHFSLDTMFASYQELWHDHPGDRPANLAAA